MCFHNKALLLSLYLKAFLKLFKTICALLLCCFALQQPLLAQKKKMTSVSGFTLREAPSEEDRQKALQKQLVNPIRKFLNGFNFHIEKSLGYFSYRSALSDVSVLRDPTNQQLYIVPIGQEASITPPINAFSNWFTDLTPTTINRIDDDSQIIRTDTINFAYTNWGRVNPWNFRLDYSFKKVDKAHQQRTGEKRYLEQDLFRIGVGISFGAFKFKQNAHQQEADPVLRVYPLAKTKISSTKMFGSASYNFYSMGDLTILADVYGGVWKSKTEDINETIVTYDPFFNVGIMFQTTWSKYFKGYIRPSFEMRSYTLANELVSIPHNFTIFSVDLGLILKYPTYPRNKYQAHMVQMEHVFNGKIYRGRPFYRKQNPRTGQRRRGVRRGDESSFSIKNNNKNN